MVTYEWIVECLDENGDIYDVRHFDSYCAALSGTGHYAMPYRIGLVREVGNDIEGMTERLWAYVHTNSNGVNVLPLVFECGDDMPTDMPVPIRFHAELKRENNNV